MINVEQTNPMASRPSSLFDTVSNTDAGYCETFSAPGLPRESWQNIMQAFDTMGPEQLRQRQRRARRMRHEDGATYNPFENPIERTSTWPLDIFPQPITAEEWSQIERGIVQRAHLLEQVLADVYGPQQLLRGGQIPAELLYANPNFLRPCHNIIPPGNRFLSFYAADLYREVDGTFRVYRDYGNQPSGLGYALENRIVISRIFSDLYHTTQIRRLAPFFQALHNSILERNSLTHSDPGIVLLSPGPDSPTYFEHAFLSRYLGYPLVEGQDLSVRNGQVFLKKLAGLEQVEAIFRQVADNVSDPFALRRQTADGIAGLVQASREGTIDLINPIGSGFIDTPLLSRYLPDLCQYLRGEPLLLPERRTWWCGSDEDRRHLLANLSQLIVEPALDRSVTLSADDGLAQAINAAPYTFQARQPLLPGKTPVWNRGKISTQPSLLRVFVCATQSGFTVMPGGLAITAKDVQSLISPNPEQQQSKDVWVLSEQPVEPFSLLEGLQTTTEFNRSSDLPSRVADNMLWLGRYLERAEGKIRLMRSVFRRLSGEAGLREIPELKFLLQLQRGVHLLPGSISKDDKIPPIRELKSALFDALYSRENPESVIAILWKVQETARNVRDRLSLDCWRVINHLEDFLLNPAEDPHELLEDTLYNLSAFSGLAMESMTRGLGWRFMDMGRRLERAMFQTSILKSGLPLVCADSRNALEALLEVGDSIMTYRARYRTTFQLAPVLDLLIVDETNPKSLAFQFSQLATHVEHLPRQHKRRYSSLEERLALEMLTSARLLDLHDTSCEVNDHAPLSTFFISMEKLLLEFAQQITAHYLSRVPSTPHFSTFYKRGGEE